MFKKALLIIAISLSSSASVTFEEYEMVKSALYDAFKELSPSTKDRLSINTPIPRLEENYWWNIDMVHASYVRQESEDSTIHNIYLMGGFSRLQGMTPDGLALTGCHEIGHGIGGAPKKRASHSSEVASTSEGQSDYFATRVCLPVVLKYLEQSRELTSDTTAQRLCLLQKLHSTNNCLRLFSAIESDIYFFSTYAGHTSFDDHATEVAETFNDSPSFYPSVQCRVDTMIHGILNLERPQCWFPGGASNGLNRL